MGRVKQKHSGERFVGVPHWVMQSAAYRNCSHAAIALLLDIALQYNGRNNGLLVACEKYLRPLGWKSNDTVTRAKAKLVECGLLIETRKGQRPNKAAWYALGWRILDVKDGLDIDPRAYRTISQREIIPLTPLPGVVKRGIAPSPGVEKNSPTPRDGAMRGVLGYTPTPGNGGYIDLPYPALGSSQSIGGSVVKEGAPCS